MSSSFNLSSLQREEIGEAVARIKKLTQLPGDFLTGLLVQQQQYTCIKWLVHFKIFSAIPVLPKAISYEEIARQTSIPVQTLKSVARMAMTANFLDETKDGQLCHSPTSCALAENKDLTAWLSYLLHRSVPCMEAFIKATEEWPSTSLTNQTAYNIAFDTDLSFFDHLKANHDLGAEFGAYMKSQSTVHQGASVNHLLHGFDWSSLGDAEIIDVGGGHGDASVALAREYSRLRFVIQDLKHSGEGARAKFAALDESVARRLHFQEHDFFMEQNIKAADVYLLRMIIHDWPDDEAIKIIREIATAMKPKSRILIMDMILPAPGGPLNFESALRQKDLMMRQVLNAREREVEDWVSLINQVHPKLEIVDWKRPEGSQLSIMEVKLRD